MARCSLATSAVNAIRSLHHWRWHLDEVYVKINGDMHYLWRAVDHEGEILESYITKTRDKAAALVFMKKALKRHGSPEAITTDSLGSYRAAMKVLDNADKQEVGRWANNRAAASTMDRFEQMEIDPDGAGLIAAGRKKIEEAMKKLAERKQERDSETEDDSAPSRCADTD